MTTYGPFSPAGWTSADQVCCSTSSFNAVTVQGEGGYIDDTDSSTYSVALRFPVDTTGMVTFTSASLVLTRSPNAYGNGGTNGVISIRLEDTTSSEAYSSGANPYGRTYRTVEVEYDFPNDNTTVTIDLSAIFSDFYGAHSPGAHTLTLMFGAQQRGWTASSVSYRCVTNQQNTGGVLPSLTIVGSSGGGGGGDIVGSCAIGVACAGALSAIGAIVAGAALGVALGGTVAGKGSVGGATTVGVSSSGVVSGAGGLTGSSAVGVASGGSVSGAGAVSGGATIGVRASGTFALAGEMAGACAVGLTASGGLVATGFLGGGQNIGVANSATAMGSAALGGSLAFGANASGGFSGAVLGTQYPSLADYFTHTIPGRPRTVMFWGRKAQEYDYLSMSGGDYIYSDISFTGTETPSYRVNAPAYGEHGWFKFEKGQGTQYVELDQDYYGIFCFAVVYRANGTTDVYYAREGNEMVLMGTITTTAGDSTEWWFGMFEGVVRWHGMTEYLYIDNTEWNLTRIRAQSKQRNPTAAIWGFYPLEGGSGDAETYGSNMTRHGDPIAASDGVVFPIIVLGDLAVTVSLGGALGGLGSIAGTAALGAVTSGSIAGAATVGGSLALGIVTSGAARGSGAISGAIACGVGDASTMVGRANLSGGATVSIVTSGEFPLPTGGAEGRCSVAVGCSGALRGDAALGGSCSVTLVNVAAVAGVGALVGQTALGLAYGGVLRATGGMLGSAALGLGSVGAEDGFAALVGESTINVSAAGVLSMPPGMAVGALMIGVTCATSIQGSAALAGGLRAGLVVAGVAANSGYTRPFASVTVIGHLYLCNPKVVEVEL